MAKKEYPIEVAELEILKGFNQTLKKQAVAWCYHRDKIYMQTQLGFIDKIAIPIEPLHYYTEIFVNPETVGSWLSHYRKTFASVTQDETQIYLKDTKSEEEATIQKLPVGDEACNRAIVTLYNSYFKKEAVTVAVDRAIKDPESFTDISFIMPNLRNKEAYSLETPEKNILLLSRPIFGEMRYTEFLKYREIHEISIPNHDIKTYLFWQREKGLDIYTLGAFLV